MNSYQNHAMREFVIAGWCNEAGEFGDDMQRAICTHVLDLLQVFGDEGHSGSSAPYAVGLFEKLALFKTITPLTGEDNEWVQVTDELWQNKRDSAVFKDANNVAWYINGKVFVEPSGASYTSRESHVPVTFPYTPHTEYIHVEPCN